jgi:GT2 family glycosyltransferase/glycosyltransferase involved in cell wall biosynthesis
MSGMLKNYGKLLRLRDGRLEGYAYDANRPDLHLEVLLYINSELCNKTLATHPHQNIGDGHHGFIITALEHYYNNQVHEIDLRIVDNAGMEQSLLISPLKARLGAPAPQIIPAPKPQTLPSYNPYDGRIDLATFPKLQGWAWNKDNHAEIVELAIWLDGELLDQIAAKEMREDLRKAGIADGSKAFNYQINKRLDPSKQYQIDVRFARNSQSIKNSPLTLEFSKQITEYRPHITKIKADGEAEVAPDIDINACLWQLDALENAPQISVIIPIYNAFEAVENCLSSVLAFSQIANQIILINDASTDKRIKPYLNKLQKTDARIKVLHNKTNLGYTKTINIAISRASDNDIVLLNSDTIVTPNWLQQLQITAYEAPNIGTVTAISNNAGAFSVPELESNSIPETLSLSELGRLIRQQSLHIKPITPTANGFCTFIKRDLLNKIGLFDEQNFPRGYGEENDLSMRASAHGFVHKVADSCFVWHERSASFGEEKLSLTQNAKQQLDKLYPEYSKLASDFCISPAMQKVRNNVRNIYANINDFHPKPRILYVIHGNATGGTPQTNRDLMNAMQDGCEIYLLECDRNYLSLSKWQNSELKLEESWQLQQPINFLNLHQADYAAIIWHILQHYAIELIHIRHLYKHSFDLPRLAKALHIPVILSLHDFYFVCPTINLIDENSKFCAGICTKVTDADCPLPYHLEEKLPPLKHQYVYRFRSEVQNILPYINALVTTSEYAKQLMLQTYPNLCQADFRVIEHGRDFAKQHHLSKPPTTGEPLKIIVPAQLTKHKGADFIEQLLELDAGRGELEFHFLGNLPKQYQHLGVFHGSYERETLPQHIAAINGHAIGIFSIWAETYCHVLSESWACGMPVIASNLGALHERISKHGGGWLIDIENPQIAYQQILSIKHNKADYSNKAMQANLNNIKTIKEMADEYQELYHKFLI